MKDVLVTCPPMLRQFEHYLAYAKELGIALHPAQTKQTLSIEELKKLLPHYDGWIIGDDPTNHELLSVARKGRFKAAIKWGVGTDNIDFSAFSELGIPVDNTPKMFGVEVAELALGYAIALSRHVVEIDRQVRQGHWHKPAGRTLSGMKVAVVGYGDIGQNLVRLLSAFTQDITVYDPFVSPSSVPPHVQCREFPASLEEIDALFLTCALTADNHHLLNRTSMAIMQDSILINVSRGPLIDEEALIWAMHQGHVIGAALDVFEAEPLPQHSALFNLESCILGSHNGSNTIEAVHRTSKLAIKKISGMLHDR